MNTMVLLSILFLLAASTTDLATAKIRKGKAKPSMNVMLMEADLLTPETCEEVKRVNMFPKSTKYMGAWFCYESILGRFVHQNSIKYTEPSLLVHYRLDTPQPCSHPSFAHVKDVYIFDMLSHDGQMKIIEHTEDEAYQSEFVQKAITAAELMADTMCNGKPQEHDIHP